MESTIGTRYDRYLNAYMIYVDDLPKATKMMNYTCDFFSSRVLNIKVRRSLHRGRSIAIVFVEIVGSNPFIINEWEEVIVDMEE